MAKNMKKTCNTCRYLDIGRKEERSIPIGGGVCTNEKNKDYRPIVPDGLSSVEIDAYKKSSQTHFPDGYIEPIRKGECTCNYHRRQKNRK